MSGKKVTGVLILVIAIAAILKAGTLNVIDYIDQKIDSQIESWAAKNK